MKHGELCVDASVLSQDGAKLNLATRSGHFRKPSKVDWSIWHHRLGHQNYRQLKTTEGNVEGMKLVGEELADCVQCYEGKSMKVKIPKSPTKATRVGEKLHVDPVETSDVSTNQPK